jgi:2-oxoglutarate dehydrogenase complex dehydrogenase (E1) component-like enzyme
VREEVFQPDDSDSVYESYLLSLDASRLQEAALETIAEYINTYQNDPNSMRNEWPHVFEALTQIPA